MSPSNTTKGIGLFLSLNCEWLAVRISHSRLKRCGRFCNHGAKMQLAEYLATVYLKSGIQSKVQMYKPTNQTYNTSRYFNSKVSNPASDTANLRNCIIKMTGLASLNHGWKLPSETWTGFNKVAAHSVLGPKIQHLKKGGANENGPIRGMFLKPCKSWGFQRLQPQLVEPPDF